MDRYLILSDIDGTLMTSEQTISTQTLKFIKELQSQGHFFFVATGRMHLSALKIAKNINEHVGVIASNGGILSIDGHQIQHTLDNESSLAIYRLAMKHELPLFFFTQDTVYYSLILPDYFQNKTNQGRVDAGQQESYVKIKNEEHLIKNAHQFINAIIISEDHFDRLKIAKDQLSQIDSLTVTSSFMNNIEISPKGISKAIAIQELQKYYNIDQDHTISFGDGGNDIDMFKVSGISVAMENASDDVKKHATHITSSNNDDGVYHFLKNYFKENKNGN